MRRYARNFHYPGSLILAAQQGLSFVPLASERYFLAMRSATAAGAAAQALMTALRSRWFRKIMRDMPGYAAPARVNPMSVQDAFEQPLK